MRIVIAIDSFKGCLTSMEAGRAAAEGVRAALPDCLTVVLPVADGGEGMLDVLLTATCGQRITLRAHDPLMRLRDTSYGLSIDGRTAFIEMAAISGLPLLAPEERNPMSATTYGTGELIRDALERGCTRIIIGLGGSATCDAGVGMLQALGYRVVTENSRIVSIDASAAHPLLRSATFTAACDVRNPFFGPDGAARVFAPQKGAAPEMVEQLEAAMQHLAGVIRRTTGHDISTLARAGAAGGMGGTLHAFFGAQLKPGIELLLETLRFDRQIKEADLVITGEGKADRQTLMGKVPMGILQAARRQHIPVALIAGQVEDNALLEQAGFRTVCSIHPAGLPLEQAMRPETATENIRRTVRQLLKQPSDNLRLDKNP